MAADIKDFLKNTIKDKAFLGGQHVFALPPTDFDKSMIRVWLNIVG